MDAFDNILEATSNQEAVYAFYWVDDNNKMKVTEIFDMTNSDSPAIQTTGERKQLESESDWDAKQLGKIGEKLTFHTSG